MLPQPSGRRGIQTPNVWGHKTMLSPLRDGAAQPARAVCNKWMSFLKCVGLPLQPGMHFLLKTIIGECRPNFKTAKFVFNRHSCHLSSSNLISKAWTLGLYKSQKSIFLIPTSDSPILLPNTKWLHDWKLWNWRCRVELKLLMWLQSMGSQRVGHDRMSKHTHTHMWMACMSSITPPWTLVICWSKPRNKTDAGVPHHPNWFPKIWSIKCRKLTDMGREAYMYYFSKRTDSH